jgi:hypothetical protein
MLLFVKRPTRFPGLIKTYRAQRHRMSQAWTMHHSVICAAKKQASPPHDHEGRDRGFQMKAEAGPDVGGDGSRQVRGMKDAFSC